MAIETSPEPAFDRDAFNTEVEAWAAGTLMDLRQQMGFLNIRRTGRMLSMLSYRVRKRYGAAHGVGFTFPRYGVYVHVGARKGYGGRKGSQWWSEAQRTTHKRGALKGQTTRGGWKRTNPESFNRMGTGRSAAKPWLNPVLDARMDELADIMVRHQGSVVMSAFKDMKIK